MVSVGRGPAIKQYDEVLIWTDNNGQRHRAYVEIQGADSSLYEPDQDTRINIRYNLADPDLYCVRQLRKDRGIRAAASALTAVIVAAIFILVLWAIAKG